MHKKVMFVLIVALLVMALPTAVFAAAPAPVMLHVRNTTGGPVELSLTDEVGNVMFYSLVEGINHIELVDGLYGFYASTLCGVQTGVWNLSATDTYILKCQDGALGIEKPANACDVGLYIYHDRFVYRTRIFIPWAEYGRKWAGIAPWDNESQFTEFYLNEYYLYSGYDWGCYDGDTRVQYGLED